MQPFTVSDVYALRMLLVFFLFLSYFCVMKAKKRIKFTVLLILAQSLFSLIVGQKQVYLVFNC